MRKPIETEPQHIKRELEQRGYLYFDPVQLLAANAAGQIINPKSIQQMEGRFDPDLFDVIKVVRVVTPEGHLWLVTDGLNRLNYAASHKDDTFPNRPDFSLSAIKAFDATESYLQNPKIVIPGEHPQSLQALTFREYYRAVLPPTVVHAEIAPQRVAAHLIRLWEGMVGEKVAKKFSLIAALERVWPQTQDNFFANQTQEEKKIITQALREIEASAQEHNLSLVEVKRIAFMLVVNRSQIIGGETKALKEVQGMMYHPEIDRKLKEKLLTSGEREIVRSNIGKYVVDMLKAGGQSEYSAPAHLEFIRDVLLDKELNIADVGNILSDLDPNKVYEEIRRERNYTRLEEYYRKAHKTDVLSEQELYFLEKFGKVVRIEHDFSTIASIVKSASAALQMARDFTTELRQEAETLIKTGVTGELIENSFDAVKKIHDYVQNRRTPYTLRDNISQLNEVLTKVRKQIKQQQCLHWTGNIIVKEMGSFDAGVAHFLIRELDLINQPLGKNEAQAQRLLSQFSSLDSDLHHDVVLGLTRLEEAVRRQNRRRIKDMGPAPIEPVSSSRPAVLPPVQVTVDTILPTGKQDVTLVDRDRAEIRRKEINNQRMARILMTASEGIAEIDLDPKDYDQRAKDMLHSLTKQLGKLVVGHPDILRTHAEWKRVEDEKAKARAAKIENDQEQAYKDTRTKQ